MTAIQIQKNEYLFPALSALAICLFLFYIDEGYMDFSWIGSVANWGIFSLYVTGFFLGFAMITAFVTHGSQGWKKKLVIFLLGMPLSCVMTVLIMFFGCLILAIWSSVI